MKNQRFLLQHIITLLSAVLVAALLGACAELATPVVPTAGAESTATPSPKASDETPTPDATDFAYLVRITDSDDQPIPRAHVLIEIEGAAPFDQYADDNGYIREFLKPEQDNRPARLIVEAEGFRSYR